MDGYVEVRWGLCQRTSFGRKVELEEDLTAVLEMDCGSRKR
jgi:hypothetical protein